jgi:hypothetical protein
MNYHGSPLLLLFVMCYTHRTLHYRRINVTMFIVMRNKTRSGQERVGYVRTFPLRFGCVEKVHVVEPGKWGGSKVTKTGLTATRLSGRAVFRPTPSTHTTACTW